VLPVREKVEFSRTLAGMPGDSDAGAVQVASAALEREQARLARCLLVLPDEQS